MPEYQVYCTWTMAETFTIEAESLDAAIQIAKDKPLTNGEYLEDSFTVDREFSEELTESALAV